MKQNKYIGIFINKTSQFSLYVYAFSFREAYYLLIAKAIEKGNQYDLYSIEDSKTGQLRYCIKPSENNIFMSELEIDYLFDEKNKIKENV